MKLEMEEKPPIGSALITKEVVIDVVDALRPAIMEMMKRGHLKREDLHLVVLDPGLAYLIGNIGDGSHYDIKNAILYEESFGDDWAHDYLGIARGKAKVTLRTGLPSLHVVQFAPHLLLQGDPKYGGSVIMDGIITSASGAFSFQDLMISEMVASGIKARGIFLMQEALKDSGKDFM